MATHMILPSPTEVPEKKRRPAPLMPLRPFVLPPRKPARTKAVARPVLTHALLESTSMQQPRRALDVVISLILHGSILAVLILLPLYFTQSLDLSKLATTFIVAPPPPPPPPPPAAVVHVAPRPTFITQGKLVAPTVVPQKITMIKEAPLSDASLGVIGGVPGGVPGGEAGGVIGGILGGVPQGVAQVKRPSGPVRVGGDIKAPQRT